MKRPLATVGFAYCLTLAVTVHLISLVSLSISVMATIFAIVAFLLVPKYNLRIIVISIPVILALIVIPISRLSYEADADEWGGRTCDITGEITDMPRKQSDRWYYIIQTDSIDGQPQTRKLLLTCRTSLETMEGDQLIGTVTFMSETDSTVPDDNLSLRADGISLRAWCSPYTEYDIIHSKPKLRYLPQRLRRSTIQQIHATFSAPYAALLQGMLLGDTAALDEAVVEHFRSAGIAHVLAVSGLHVSLLTGCACFLLRGLRLSQRSSTLLTMLLILLFMAVTGFSPSVTRAGVMHLMTLAGTLCFRHADALTSMALSLLIMCLVNPWCIADVGLQLSCASTLGLLLLQPWQIWRIWQNPQTTRTPRRHISASHAAAVHPIIAKRLMMSKTYVIRTFQVSVTASLFTLPLSTVYFGRVSLIAPLTNILCLFAVTLFLVTGIAAVLLHAIPAIGWLLALPFRAAAMLSGRYLLAVTALLGQVPLGHLNAGYEDMPLFFGGTLAVIIAAGCMVKRFPGTECTRRAILAAFSATSMMLLVTSASRMLFLGESGITILGLSDGGACLCAVHETHAMLIETGGNRFDFYQISDILSRQGVQKIDAVAAPVLSTQASGLSERLMASFPMDYFLWDDTPSQQPLLQKSAQAHAVTMLPLEGEVTLPPLALSIELYTDTQNHCWSILRSGDMTALVAPEGGNVELLPLALRRCDMAVIPNENVENLGLLTVGAVILTGEEAAFTHALVQLRLRDFSHVYLLPANQQLTCRIRRGRLYIQSSDAGTLHTYYFDNAYDIESGDHHV